MSISKGTSTARNLIAWLFCIAAVSYQLHPLLKPKMLAGWDVVPHYYLYSYFWDLLAQGKISGYDPLWYAGYPAFQMYPPLAYFILGLPHLLSFGLVSRLFSFNLAIFLLPLLFLWALKRSVQSCFGNAYGLIALSFGLIFLSIPSSYGHASLGLAALIQVGFIPSFVTLPAFILFISLLIRASQKKERLLPLKTGVLLGLITLMHTLTALMCFWLLFCFVIAHSPKKKAFLFSLQVSFLAFIISSWWWIGYWPLRHYHSGETIGLTSEVSDPLIALFPGIFERAFSESIVSFIQQAWSLNITYSSLITEFLSVIPFLSLVLLLMVVSGIKTSFLKGALFLPVAILLSLLLLPRNYLSNMTEAPIHFYRFVLYIFVLNIFAACVGFGKWCRIPGQRCELGQQQIAFFSRSFLGPLLLFFFALVSLVKLDLSKPAVISGNRNWKFHFYLEDYPSFKDAMRMVHLLAKLPLDGRILDENPEANWAQLGTPHFFSSIIPLLNRQPVANGLLVESSFSAAFINAASYKNSDHLRWGRKSLWNNYQFRKQSLNSMIERLKLYRIDYIVSTTPHFTRALRHQHKLIKRIRRVGRFQLFKIRQRNSLATTIQYQPFLFVRYDSRPSFSDFRVFSERWYQFPQLLSTPVIWSDKQIQKISNYDFAQLGGIIVDCKDRKRLNRHDISFWLKLGKPLIIIHRDFKIKRHFPKRVRIINFFESNSKIQTFTDILKQSRIKHKGSTSALRINPSGISFTGYGPSIISLSYTPRFTSLRSDQGVYLATPSLTFIFGQGANKLEIR